MFWQGQFLVAVSLLLFFLLKKESQKEVSGKYN